jgi:hypothetical protein
LQLEIVPETVLMSVFVGTCILFLLYLILKTCTGGKIARPERRGGTPRVDDLTATQSAYGHEVSYAPGARGSTAGPFPVGGKTERLPTRSFQSYTKPRRKSKKS